MRSTVHRGRLVVSVALGLVAAPFAGCGGASESAPAPARPEVVANDDAADSDGHDRGDSDTADDGMEVEGLKGHLDPYDIEKGIEPHRDALARCYHDGARRQRYIDGKIELAYTVSGDGRVKSVMMQASDLGAWPIERCILKVARGMEFAAPSGGKEATFSLPLDFSGSRARVQWLTEEQAEAEVREYVGGLGECAEASDGGDPGSVIVTLYVGPRGKVKSVGFANEGREVDQWAECAAERIKGWQLTDPRGRIAKLAFVYQ